MTKNSILKKLLAIGVGTVCVTTGALFAACDKKDDNNNGGNNPPPIGAHTHQWSTGNEAGAWGSNTTHHWRICLADGHGEQGKTDAEGYGAHVYDNEQDTSCNTCGYTRNIGGGEENPGAHTNVTVNASDLTVGTLTDGTSLGTGVKITGAPAVDSNSKSVIYKGETISISNRIKLSSKLTNKDTPMGIEITAGAAAKVIVYYYSGSSGQTRGLELYEADKTTLVAGSTQALSDGNVMATAMFDISAAGTYYIGASVAGVNVYYLAVVYDEVGETWTPHEAKAAECGVPGNIAYSESNYGRYKDANDNFIMANKYTIAALKHSYTLKAGSLTLPTATTEGSVTLTCANGHDTPVELPVLTSDKYSQVENATDSTKSDYTITVEGVEIKFTTDKAETVETVWNTVYDTDMLNLHYAGLGEANAVAGTGGKTYYTKNKDTDAESAVNVSSDAGVVTVSGANTYFVLDNAVDSGLIKISGKINVKSTNTGWTFLQIKNATGTEIFGIRAEKNVGLIPRYVGVADTTTVIAATYANVLTEFEIVIDCTAKKISLKWGGVEKIVDASLNTEALDISSLMLNVNTGRTVSIQDLVFSVPQA